LLGSRLERSGTRTRRLFELDREYAALSAVRFLEGSEPRAIRRAVEQIAKGKSLAL
jgi:hypothetical protein